MPQGQNTVPIETIAIDITRDRRPDGTTILRSAIPLDDHPFRLTAKLLHWAGVEPNRIFLGEKNVSGAWDTITYGETLTRIQAIAQALIDRKLSADRPIAILSENSIEHALLGMAALHAGIPYSAVSPAYSLRSNDFDKLRYVIGLLRPGLIMVSDASLYEPALNAVAGRTEVIISNAYSGSRKVTSFNQLQATVPTQEVAKAYDAITPDTIAKILFTSGSTGLPKGVINTHGNISTNWQQITQTFPFLKEQGQEYIDWLPWNHTYGGNHNFGIALFNGGTLYIDGGNPTPQSIEITVANIRERRPTVYFNVPRGFEELIPFFERDESLRKQFFSRLKMLFYAGASMPQHVWEKWEALSVETTGSTIRIATGLGCTETCPSALFASGSGGYENFVGVPAPGLELKLASVGDQLEARYRGKNVFPGYWQQPEMTAAAFDEEGFYRSGDALRWVDEREPNQGMLYDGRITEDFKLTSGTWVRVGALRAQLIAVGDGLIQDVVFTGHDRDFVGAIVFVGAERCRHLCGVDDAPVLSLIHDDRVVQAVQNALRLHAKTSRGSSTLIRRAIIAGFIPTPGRGEVTDKGTINQNAVILNHPELIGKLHGSSTEGVIIV